MFALEDMIPLPCNPDQICIGYGLRHGVRGASRITAMLPREICSSPPRRKHRDVRGLSQSCQKAVFNLLSLSTAQADTTDKLAGLLCCLPEAVVPENLAYEHTFRVVISQFLDRYNFDLATVKRSCVHFVEPDGRIIPLGHLQHIPIGSGADGCGSPGEGTGTAMSEPAPTTGDNVVGSHTGPLLMAVGGMIILLCGGCTVFFLGGAIWGLVAPLIHGGPLTPGERNDAMLAPAVGVVAIIVGGLPTALGTVLFFGWRVDGYRGRAKAGEGGVNRASEGFR